MGKRKGFVFGGLWWAGLAWLACFFLLTACGSATPSQGQLQITIQVDANQISTEIPAGSTVQFALDKTGITLGNLDRVEPPAYTLLTGAIPRDRVERALELSREKYCSVWHSLRQDIRFTTSFEVLPG